MDLLSIAELIFIHNNRHSIDKNIFDIICSDLINGIITHIYSTNNKSLMEKFNINAFKNLTNAGVKINEENQILFIENNIKNLMDSKIDSSVVTEQHIKEYIKQYPEYYDSAFVYIADKKHLSHLKTEIMIEYIIHYNEDKYAFNNYVNSITDENTINIIISRSVKSLLKFKDSILYSKAVEFAIELHPISSITINWSTVSDINKIKALVKDKYCFIKLKLALIALI